MVAEDAKEGATEDTEETPEENLWLEARNDSLEFKPIEPRHRTSRGSGRSVKFLLAFLVALALGAAWFVWGKELFGSKTKPVPLIKAEAGAIKTRPERPGGLDVPNRDKLIYGRLEKDPPKSTTETLLPRPEVPLPPRAKPKPAPKAGKEPPAPKTPPAPTTLGASGEKAPPAAGLPLVALAKRKPAPTLPPAAPPLPRAEQKKPGKAVVAAIKPPPAAPPPPAPSPPAGEVAAPADGFLIQIAALRSAQAAREEWRRLSAKHNEILGGLKLVLVRADLGAKGIYFRLRAGPFRTRETAKDACLSLAERKIGCLVIRPGG